LVTSARGKNKQFSHLFSLSRFVPLRYVRDLFQWRPVERAHYSPHVIAKRKDHVPLLANVHARLVQIRADLI
jgi:hypothetical protein